MPSRERVAALIALVEQGMLIDALHEFYAEDAQAQDNQEPPRQGRERLVANARHLLRSVRGLRVWPVDEFLVDGDQVQIHWAFEFTGHDGRRRVQHELAQQRWRDDRIVEERLHYDPVQQPLVIDPLAAAASAPIPRYEVFP